MTPKPKNLSPGLSGTKWSRLACASLALAGLLGGQAIAAQKSYKYFRFQPTRIQADGTRATMSEFTFSLNGTVLNLTTSADSVNPTQPNTSLPGRNGTTTNLVLVSATYGSQSTTTGTHPNLVFDGRPAVSGGTPSTRWRGPDGVDPLSVPFDITFPGGPVTVDSYNFATSSDSSLVTMTPVSWQLLGRNDTSAPWELIDVRSNVAVNTANSTYQAGFTMPESITPAVNYFRLADTATLASPAIVRNSDANGVKLEWDASLGDTTISPPGNPVPLTGSATFDPPDNATTTYTFAATVAQPPPGTSATRTLTVRSVAGGTSSYRYLRFKCIKLRNGTGIGLIQISEFGFMNNGTGVIIDAVSNPGGDNPANEGIANLIDANNANKWLDRNNGYAVFDLGEPNPPFDENQITDYFFVTGNDATERDPLQWTLEGTNDDPSSETPVWTLIENVNFDYPTPTARNTTTRSIPLPGATLPPSVTYFRTEATTAFEGTPVKLSWSVNGAASISIDNSIGTVAATGSMFVTPPVGTITYTLTANSAGNAATSINTATLNVLPGPAPSGVDFANFGAVTNEFTTRGSATFTNNVLQLTPDTGGQQGEAWHRVKQPVAGGFEATFGLSMTHAAGQPADGVSFIVQNHPLGSNAPSTGETGVASNALNICFITYGGNAADASRIQVRTPSDPANPMPGTTSASNIAGITYQGITGFAYPTMTGMPGSEPYRIRVVYTPDPEEPLNSVLDVYVNDVAVLEHLPVDLGVAGAVDENGNAFVGFAGRTGGLTQLNQITYWQMRYGDFKEVLPFGVVKSFKNTLFPATPTWDIVWNSVLEGNYTVQSSDTLDPEAWTDEASYIGDDGQIGHKISINAIDPKRFYRVVEELPEGE